MKYDEIKTSNTPKCTCYKTTVWIFEVMKGPQRKWCVKRTEACWIYFFLVVDMLLYRRISIASALQQLLRWREVDDSNANWWGCSKAWLSMTFPYLGSGRCWNNWRRPQLLENHLEALAHFQVARQTCFLCVLLVSLYKTMGLVNAL